MFKTSPDNLPRSRLLEVDMIRNKIQHTLTLSMWVSLIPGGLKSELARNDRLRKIHEPFPR